MRVRDGTLVYSPTDLCGFMRSRFACWMDRYFLDHREEIRPDEPSDDQHLVRRRGLEHENVYVEGLRESGHDVVTIPDSGNRGQATLEAMQAGAEFVQQAELSRGPLTGYADLLVRTDGRSDLGEFHYVPLELKLALRAKPEHLVQLSAYADMLEAIQGVRPARLEIILGTGQHEEFRTEDHIHHYRSLRQEFLKFIGSFDPGAPPVPEARPAHGRWSSHAARRLEELDHLSCVANIRRTQIARLEAAGITTLTALAESTLERVPRLDPGIFKRLRTQAGLQLASAGLDRPEFRVIPPDPQRPSGLALLPPASPADVYFDMEGFPWVEGGLEYLFGASHVDGDGRRCFSDWWAHDAEQERVAFEAFIDWVHARWRQTPSMRVYHYAPYEITALRRLMGRHVTREAALDQLLRNEVFVDLYTVVRQGLLVGEPGYSIKNVERLYREARETEVGSGGDSILEYQRWRDSDESGNWRESPILESLREYNRDDCESTLMLTEWLRERQKENGIAYAGKPPEESPGDPLDALSDDNLRRHDLAQMLIERDGDMHGQLLGRLVEFHRREEKPMWWEMFERHAKTDAELYEDLACLGQLERTGDPPERSGRSAGAWYAFDPDQDTRLDDDRRRKCFLAHDLEARVEIGRIDPEQGRVLLRFGPRTLSLIDWPPPDRLSLIPDEYIPAQILQESIQRTAENWLNGHPLPPALEQLFARRPPVLRCHDGGPLARGGEQPSDAAVRLVHRLDRTVLSIQGPPGSGKTYTAARMILELIDAGKRVGVTSNSHKAVLNLMVKCAQLRGAVPLSCLKVGGDAADPILELIPGVQHVVGGRDGAASARSFALVGGTAWLFSRRDMVGAVDQLFVDEAGQVSLANLVAMAHSAGNIVLVGDQMQLAQPIQGTHPEDSGDSTLQYLLEGEPTIPADRGLFLDMTYRLHPDICRLNSEAFYEGKLHSAPGCEQRRILLDSGKRNSLPRGAGIVFLPVEHEGNTQGSDEEVEVVHRTFRELLGREHTDTSGAVAGTLGIDDILVVAPYNMQVRNLQRKLPDGARVGSVDKFQGQEAPVVIISMCASEAHDSPRGLEFLLSPNRLNVALSRAQSLVVVVGHPGLAHTRCTTLEQLRLVSLYCRIVEQGS